MKTSTEINLKDLEDFLRREIENDNILTEFLREFLSSVQELCRDNRRVVSVYIVGGAVRDMLLKKFYRRPVVNADIDLVLTGLKGEEITLVESMLRKGSGRGLPRGVQRVFGQFPVIKVYLKGQDSVIDIAIARRGEKSTGPGHRDFAFVTEGVDIKDDLLRRDFTINAVALRIKPVPEGFNCKVVDVCGGIEDIRKGVISAIGVPESRYREDPVRQLRAIRFLAQFGGLGFRLDESAMSAIECVYPDTFMHIPMEPLVKEAGRAFALDFESAYRCMARSGILKRSFPFLCGMDPDDVEFITRAVFHLRKFLNPTNIWVPLIFSVTKSSEGDCMDLGKGFLPYGRKANPKASSLVAGLRLPKEVDRQVQCITIYFYHDRCKYPLSALEYAFNMFDEGDKRDGLIELACHFMRKAGRDTAPFLDALRLLESKPLPYTSGDLEVFYEEKGIEEGPVRREMLRAARELNLSGKLEGREEFFREAFKFYERSKKGYQGSR